MELKIEIGIIYRENYSQLKRRLHQKFNFLNLATVEDLIQEAFTKAMDQWPRKGLPENPSGWLYQCCRNDAIDLIQRSKQNEKWPDNQLGHTENTKVFKNQIEDERLRTLFDCCHPDLTPRTQIVLALKYVFDFKTDAIARQFGISADAVEKMLYRTRQKFKLEGLQFNDPTATSYKKRLHSIHKVIYLIFTEGWKQLEFNKDQAQATCEEALILNTELIHSPLSDCNTLALQALILFNISRFESRLDNDGKPIDIEHQNRALWNAQLISLGHRYLVDAESTDLSPLHLEAAIAYKHCSATTFAETDWDTICRYYYILLKMHASPFVEINYAIALYYNGNTNHAQEIFSGLKRNRYLNASNLLKKAVAEFNMKSIFSFENS